jgi:quercetin dioxygenase-like cupin family protein
MSNLRTICAAALGGLAGMTASVEWSGIAMAQERAAVASAQPIRRVVTGHDASRTARVIKDGPATNARRGASGSVSTLIWSTDRAPADIAIGETVEDLGARILGTAPPRNGSRFVVIDYPPGNKGVMHRTETIDYVIVLAGEIDMELDNSTVKLRAADVLVQRGTHHAWHNRGTAPARLAFVLIDASPLGIGHPRP